MPRLTVKPVIYKKDKEPHQEATIAIRVTFNGINRHQETNYRSRIEWFDEATGIISKEHPNHVLANNSISKQFRKIEFDLFVLREEPDFSIRMIENYLSPKSGQKKSFTLYVNQYCKDQTELYEKTSGREGKSPGTILNYEKSLRKLHFFAGKTNVTFAEIDKDFLDRYKLWMLSDKPKVPGQKRNRGHNKNSYTTVWDTLTKFICKFFNESKTPLPAYDFPQVGEGTVEYLTLPEVLQIEAILPDLSGEEYSDALYFLLECYAGIRHSDWTRYSIEKLIEDDNFKVYAKKNKEPIYLSLANRPRLAAVLELAKKTPYTGSLFKTNINLKIIGAKAGINKRISTHVGRHTCGVLHADRGFSKEYVAELLGVTMATVEVYYKVTRQKLRREDERLQGL